MCDGGNILDFGKEVDVVMVMVLCDLFIGIEMVKFVD